jgi:LemA protein
LIRLLALVLVAAAVAGSVWLYNGLIGLRNQVRNAWAQIDVQLKRRHDLIPNLVAAVQGYLRHERELFERITPARTRALAATGVARRSLRHAPAHRRSHRPARVDGLPAPRVAEPDWGTLCGRPP